MSMLNWAKISTTISGTGAKTIVYHAKGTARAIESRRVPIPHANGVGIWFHTSYFVIYQDGAEKEFNTLADAKAAAEKEEG